MKKCCVPDCNVRYTGPDKLHCLPFTSGLRWKQWLKMCPFLLKFSLRALEYQRICKKHFIREHIDYEKGRLRKDAIPLLHLPPHKQNEANSSKKLLEINPIQANEPVNFKVLSTTSSSAQTENTFKCPSAEDTNDKRQVKYLVCLKAEDTHRPPVDHNMYCLPSPADERPACLSSPCVMCLSKELLSSDRTVVSIEAGQEPGAPVDHDMYCGSPLPDHIVNYLRREHNKHNVETSSPKAECNMKTQSVAEETVAISDPQRWIYIEKESERDAASRGTVSVASQTVTGTEQSPSRLSEQNPDFISTNITHSLNDDLKTEPVESLDPQSVTLDNSDFNDNDMQDNVYVLPDNVVVDKSAHSARRKQSAVYVSPKVLKLLTAKSPLEKETLESINIMFSTLKEQYNVPFNEIPTKLMQVNKFTPANPAKINNSKLNIQPSTMKPTANMVQPAQKRTLETLVAELTESIEADETSELQASPTVTAADTPARLLNPMSDTAPCPLMQSLPVIAVHPLTSNITEKRFRHSKENNSEKEQMLYAELNKLRGQLVRAKRNNKLLKSKFKKLQETAKPYLKRYPRLTPEVKALIDTQLRLAGSKPRAARYTEEEKLFALKLHQISPDCYRFLQQYLKLPTKTTMLEFLKNA